VLPRGDLVDRFASVARVVTSVLLVARGSQNNQFWDVALVWLLKPCCIPPRVVAELPTAPGQVQSSGQDRHSVAHRCAAKREQGNVARRLKSRGFVTKLRA